MHEHLQAIQTTGPTGSTVPEIQLADLLGHPALAGLHPDERAALHLAAEHLEHRAAAGVALRVRVAHVGDLVPVSLLDARASVYSTIDAPRELHIWMNGDDVAGKSGMAAPVLLQVLAAAAGLRATGDPWAAVALPPVLTLNAAPSALADGVQPVVIQSPTGEAISI
jgi:hypothetical protein